MAPDSTPSQKTPKTLLAFITLLVCTGVYCALFGATWWLFKDSDKAFPRVAHEFYMWGLCIGLLWAYCQGFFSLKHLLAQDAEGEPRTQWLKTGAWIVGGGFLIFGVFALLTHPFQSTDLHGYINRGWQQVQYHTNPYVTTIDGIPDWGHDVMFRNHWVNNPCPYGFLFAHLARWVCELGHGDWGLTMRLFKLLSWLAVVGSAGVVAWTLHRLKQPRTEILLTLYLFLWNPLLLMHQLLNGHNDILMGFFSTLGAGLGLLGAVWWILPAFVAAGFIKYLAFILIPFGLIRVWQQTPSLAVRAGALGLALAVAGFIAYPYILDLPDFKLGAIGTNAVVTHNSLAALIHHFYKNVLSAWMPFLKGGIKPLNALVKLIIWGGFAVIYCRLLWGWLNPKPKDQTPARTPAFPQQSHQEWLTHLVLVQFLLVCWVSSKFYAWYLGMFFPMAFLLPPGHCLRRIIIVVSCAQLLSITFLGQAHMVNFIVMMVIPTLAIALPAWAKHQRQQCYHQLVP